MSLDDFDDPHPFDGLLTPTRLVEMSLEVADRPQTPENIKLRFQLLSLAAILLGDKPKSEQPVVTWKKVNG